MNTLLAPLAPPVEQHVRPLALSLSPAGPWRERVRFHIARGARRWRLTGKPRDVPPLPNLDAAAAVVRYPAHFNLDPPAPDEDSNSDRIFHWLDFHPHVLTAFPL